jgi:hypothetical protein
LEDRTVPSSVQGTVFNDANKNGVFDSGEAGVPGWTVFVDNANGTILDPGEVTAVTDANGNYFIDTTAIPPNANGWNYFSLDLQAGSGGRWSYSTPRKLYAHPVNEPTATGRDFGVHFEPYVSVEPDGPETLVNTTTAGIQGLNVSQWQQFPHAVAADANGNYVVAWQSPSDGSTPAVLARVFNANGTPRTGELVVASASGVYSNPQVAISDNGRFVVAWPGLARLYNLDGTPSGPAFSVVPSSHNTSYFSNSVAMDAVGNFAVVYRARKNGGAATITVQQFTAAGAANGRAIDVGISHIDNGGTSLAMDATGRIVVAWEEAGGSLFVYAQRLSATGQKVGAQIVVTSAPNPGVYLSSLSMNRAGRFAVAWKDWYGTTLAAQVYDWGASVGGPVTVTGPGGQVGNSASAIDANGNVTFTWDGSEIGLRRLTAAGVLEPELLANATTQGSHGTPSIAATGNDRFVVTWQGYGPGDDAGVFMQRFKPLGMSPIGNPGGTSGDGKAFLIWNSDSEVLGGPAVIAQRAVNSCVVDDRQIVLPPREVPAIHHDRLVAVRNADDFQIDDEPLGRLWNIRLGI